MTTAMMMERSGMMTGMNPMMSGTMGGTATMPTTPQWMMVPRCTMKMEKCKGGMKITCTCDDKMSATHDAEPLHDAGRRHVQLLHDDERHDGLLLQPDDGHVQVRDDRRRRLHHLHQRRHRLLRDDPGLLRLHDGHDARPAAPAA